MSVLSLLEQAAAGSFPSDTGEIEVLPSPSGSCDAVVALTGHSIVAAGVAEGWVAERVPRDDLTGLDSAPAVELSQVQDGDARTGRARRYRSDVRSYADRDSGGVVNLGRGLDGRLDLSIELPADSRSAGRGQEIIEAARALLPRGEFLFASIAPGNARCLRAALAGGFVPIGAEVLFLVRPLSQKGEA